MLKKIELAFEWILWQSRFIIVFASLASIISAIVLVGLGSTDVWLILTEMFHTIFHGGHMEHSSVITHIISAIDSYLIATVLLIFGIGLYELFVSKIEFAEKDQISSRILVIHSLDELKEKIAKVVIMVLIVTFFKYAVSFKYSSGLDLLMLAVGIFLISMAVYFTHKDGKKKQDH